MTNKRFELTGEYVKVKESGVISTMRVTGAIARLVESATKPDADAVSFPMRDGDVPFTFASNLEVWAKGSGTLDLIEKAPE